MYKHTKGLLHFLSSQNTTLDFIANTLNISKFLQFIYLSAFELSWNTINTYTHLCFPWFFEASKNEISYSLYWSVDSDVYYVFDSFAASFKIWFYDNFTFFSWNYLHQNYLNRALYLSIIINELTIMSSAVKPIVVTMPFNIFLEFFSVRIFNILTLLITVFILTNLIYYKFQFNLNIYLLYYGVIVDSEKEFSSFDDYYWFLLLFLNMFGWYFLLLILIYIFNFSTISWVIFASVFITVCILGLPLNAFISYGIFFASYIRGSAASANLVSEAIFDIIGVIVVFSRFIIQNIRFVLVFMAFFELFEWIYTGEEVLHIRNDLLDYSEYFFNLEIKQSAHYWYFLTFFIKLIATYLYYALHLIILIFMQIGIYFILSFWLFFFLYTSFIKITTDYYFINKFN